MKTEPVNCEKCKYADTALNRCDIKATVTVQSKELTITSEHKFTTTYMRENNYLCGIDGKFFEPRK